MTEISKVDPGRYGPILSLVASSKEGVALILDDRTHPPSSAVRWRPDVWTIVCSSLSAMFGAVAVLPFLGVPLLWSLVVGELAAVVGAAWSALADRLRPVTSTVVATGGLAVFATAYRMSVGMESPAVAFAVASTVVLVVVSIVAAVRREGAEAENGRAGHLVALFCDRLEWIPEHGPDVQPESIRFDPSDEVRVVEKDGCRTVYLTARSGTIRASLEGYVVRDMDARYLSDDVDGEIRSRISRL